MFIFKKHISRRTVLKGAGVTLALPFLEAMVPAATALAQTAAFAIRPECIAAVARRHPSAAGLGCWSPKWSTRRTTFAPVGRCQGRGSQSPHRRASALPRSETEVWTKLVNPFAVARFRTHGALIGTFIA